VRAQWIVLALLAMVAAALAASWGLGFWDEPAAAVAPATPTPAKPARKEPPPLDTAAWMLANAKSGLPAQAPAGPAQHEDDSACGATRTACPDDSVCIGGACLVTVCAPDAGTASACALPDSRPGTCCDGRCLDLRSDPASCGKCGITCDPGLDCVAGRCEARSCTGRMASLRCLTSSGGQGLCCHSECVDQSTWKQDAANCGGCGHACAPGLVCQQGACADPATGLPPSWNCFERGHTCPADSFCVIDACYPKTCGSDSDGQLCPGAGSDDGQIGHCCDQVCTDLFTDKNNCRACGVRCGSGEVCRNGECRQ
jgi:hypothetical protein